MCTLITFLIVVKFKIDDLIVKTLLRLVNYHIYFVHLCLKGHCPHPSK